MKPSKKMSNTSKDIHLLLLGELDAFPKLDDPRWKVERVNGPLAAAGQLASMAATVLVVDAASSWANAFVARLPPERRPAVLAYGSTPVLHPEFADEWVLDIASEEELHARLHLASLRARMRRQVARRAFVDPLTGLANRRAVVRSLVREAARAKRDDTSVSLVLLDLDGFKGVNERLGHAAGDRLLRRVGTVLRDTTRSEELCGRIGGDEFAIVIRGRYESAVQAAARAQRALSKLGVGGTTAAAERLPGERLRHLYRRTDRMLREEKHRRHEAGIALTEPTMDLRAFVEEDELDVGSAQAS